MIATLQKLKLLETALLSRIQSGRPPSAPAALGQMAQLLAGRRFGAPFTRMRAAVPGLPIGGPQGTDVRESFGELQADLSLLYQASLALATRGLDLYDIFATRRDRLALKLSELTVLTRTLLAQQSAGSRTAVTDSFNNLEKVDLTRTTAALDLDEGIVTLPPDTTQSTRYDGTRVRVVRHLAPPTTVEPGPAIETVFDPYRLNAWYALLPAGGEYEFHANVTGADYDHGASAEVPVNALRLEPTGPLSVSIDWSPDGFNWHPLNPAAAAEITDRTTFHFEPVALGFLRFRLKASANTRPNPDGTSPVGLKRIELLRRGFRSTAQLFSSEHRFSETIHTVIAELDAELPFGSRIQPYVALSADGPWSPLDTGIVNFDTRLWQEDPIATVTEEQTDNPATMWTVAIDPNNQPLPNTGELIAGRNQLEIAAYPFDWRARGDRLHIPDMSDWTRPPTPVRSGVFAPIGDAANSGEIPSTAFTTALSPLAVDTRSGSFMTLALLQGNGAFILQPGSNYRVRAFVWCPTPVTLENQSIGVVNPGGTAGAELLPLSFWANGRKLFQHTVAATSVNALSGAAYQMTVPLLQGWNELTLLLQVPQELTAGQDGLAANTVAVYLQPNLFAANVTQELGIQTVQAWKAPWSRVSEFDLRHNVAFGVRPVWAWKMDVDAGEVNRGSLGKVTAVLFNHDPRNSRNRATPHASYQTLDGLLAGGQVDLLLRYPIERPIPDLRVAGTEDPRTLFFRADFLQEPGAAAPPVLKSYRLLIN